MAREHQVRLTVPNLTQSQVAQLAGQLGDDAAVTHDINLPVTPNTTRVVMTVRAQKPQTAGERAAALVADALGDADGPAPLWEVVPA